VLDEHLMTRRPRSNPQTDGLEGLEPRVARELRTKAGMDRLLTALFGPDGWTYDPNADVWVVPDSQQDGPGRGYIVLRRGGNWRAVVIPDRMIQ
jgi:hypothetical protein